MIELTREQIIGLIEAMQPYKKDLQISVSICFLEFLLEDALQEKEE